jgi:two-component system response regulator HupR/HoxA
MKCSVFYFDDEPAVLKVFEDTFGDEYDVRTASLLADARRALAERPADVVISDQAMPEITGTEFLAEVARDYPQSYRVMLTGSMVVGEVIPELSSGVVHLFVAKPWSIDEMSMALERAGLEAYIRSLSD